MVGADASTMTGRVSVAVSAPANNSSVKVLSNVMGLGHRMTRLAVLLDHSAIAGLVTVVVTTETTIEERVGDVVGIRAPLHLHGRENISRVNVLHRGDGGRQRRVARMRRKRLAQPRIDAALRVFT